MSLMIFDRSYLPSSLINCKQSSTLVLRIIRDHDAHEQCQADHATKENVDVYVDRMNLLKREKHMMKIHEVRERYFHATRDNSYGIR